MNDKVQEMPKRALTVNEEICRQMAHAVKNAYPDLPNDDVGLIAIKLLSEILVQFIPPRPAPNSEDPRPWCTVCYARIDGPDIHFSPTLAGTVMMINRCPSCQAFLSFQVCPSEEVMTREMAKEIVLPDGQTMAEVLADLNRAKGLKVF